MKPYYSINTNRLLQKDFCIAVIARILRVYMNIPKALTAQIHLL